MATVEPDVHVWVRTAVDWRDEHGPGGQVNDAIRSRVELWNAHFTLSYHAFRFEISEIARLNLSRIRGATTTASWDEIPDGAVVLPVDDDDWFAPDTAEALTTHHDPAARGYRWPATFLELPMGFGHRVHRARVRIPGAVPRFICSTNNYAFVKRPGNEQMARRHVHASRVFESNPGDVRVLDGRLSVMNRTLASQTALLYRRSSISPKLLLRKYAGYRRLYAKELRGTPWAREYVALMAELMSRLALRPGAAP